MIRLVRTTGRIYKSAMRLFGMPLWPEKLSDEQYVERTRKGLLKLHRWRFIIALVTFGSIVAFILLIFLGLHILKDLADMGQTTKHHVNGSDHQFLYAIYYLAVVFGCWAGFMLGHALSHVVTILISYRKDKLLVEFWDALSDTEKTRLRQLSS